MNTATTKTFEPVPWISGGIVVLCVVMGFLAQTLGVQGTLSLDSARVITLVVWGVQVLACILGFFHAKEDWSRLFWILTPVILLSIMLLFTLIPDFAHQA